MSNAVDFLVMKTEDFYSEEDYCAILRWMQLMHVFTANFAATTTTTMTMMMMFNIML